MERKVKNLEEVEQELYRFAYANYPEKLKAILNETVIQGYLDVKVPKILKQITAWATDGQVTQLLFGGYKYNNFRVYIENDGSLTFKADQEDSPTTPYASFNLDGDVWTVNGLPEPLGEYFD